MKALGAGLLAATIFIVSVGFFRLWFVLPSPASEARKDKPNINLKIDADKMKQDAKAVMDKATALTNKTTNDVKADDRGNDNLKSTNP
jgi:hypothetical protein